MAAYSPLLTDNGFLVIDNGLFSTSGVSARLGGPNWTATRHYFYHTPVWQAYLASNSSGCGTTGGSNSCPCLDRDAWGCAQQGQLLSLRPEGFGWYRTATKQVREGEEGEGGVPLGSFEGGGGPGGRKWWTDNGNVERLRLKR